MNLGNIFCRIGIIALLILTILGLFWVYQIRQYTVLNPAIFPGPGDVTANPTPGRTGPYDVCTYDYDFSPVEDQWGKGRIYVPILEDEQCENAQRGNAFVTNRDFNLVIIAHADGQGPIADAHLNYSALANHLASNALIVVSINRYALQSSGGAIDIIEQVLENHLNYLYDESPVRNVITNNVGLIGHSAGGRAMIRAAYVVDDLNKNLRAVALMAPTISLNETTSFDGIANGFLGIQITEDSDFNAYGGKAEHQIMSSVFKIYDEVGVNPGNANTFGIEKDMLYVQMETVVPGGSHYFQNQPFTLAYINAFMQLHLNHHNIFRRFLKYQERPPSLNLAQVPNIWQQHEDLSRLTLADFQNGDISENTLGGDIEFSNLTITNQQVAEAHLIDPFSPHHSQVLSFETDVSISPNAEKRVTFHLPAPTSLNAYAYIGFRITQVYHPDENPSGSPINFAVEIASTGGTTSRQVSDHGGLLPFPAVLSAPVNPPNSAPEVNQSNGQTKNAMRSYLIRLSAFEGIDLAQVQSVSIDFTDVVAADVHLILDDVAFYGF
ncbi:MAG: hypothetical protein DHS20C18_39120 [Saprospiraceae bacterium]|nr:MAG: hypothetical protein DHS20C18_39120 [Saprospiraceae bacterium]